jgi:lysophospholipase L1-like esterase
MKSRSFGIPLVLKKFSVAFVMLVICLLVAEVSLRFIHVEKPSIMFKALDDHLKHNHLTYFEDVIVNDPVLFWRLTPEKRLPDDHPQIFGLISNRDGLREDHEIPRKKPEGEIRILFLGDSCTFGFGLDYRDTYVEKIENRLREAYPDVKIECINAGVSGYTLAQGWAYLEMDGIQYEPDLIFSAFGWNDAKHWSTRDDLDRQSDEIRATPPGWLANSAFCRNLWALRVRVSHLDQKDNVARVGPERFQSLMEKISALAHHHHARYLPLVWPLLSNIDHNDAEMTPYQKRSHTFKSDPPPEDGLSSINLITPMEQAISEGRTSRELFQDGVHTTARGNDDLADTVVATLTPWYESRVAEIRAAH